MAASDKPVVLVTGAAGALGAALVGELVRTGRDCVAVDRDRRGLERLHDRLAADGLAPLVVPMDLAGAAPQHFAELADSLAAEFGRLDGLIHAAADFKALTPLEHHPADQWMQVLQAGLTGPFLLCQALLGLMRDTAGSRMLFVVDSPAERRQAYWGAYGVAQAGREALAAIVAAECRRDGPAVRCVDPGPFYSPLRARAWPAENPADLPTPEQAAERVLRAMDGEH
jgi:NAD(P)-dependent dehydrogenase (short-subunit alcohol dehydrogenase family)